MKTAFSMVELIFVIVILGILAAVAIPKLSATRDDAKVTSMADSIKTAAGEIVAVVVAQGNADANLTDMSHALEKLIKRNDAVLVAVNTIEFKIGTVSNCITMQKVAIGQDVNLTVTYGVSSDPRCDQLQTLVNMSQYTIPLRGERIEY